MKASLKHRLITQRNGKVVVAESGPIAQVSSKTNNRSPSIDVPRLANVARNMANAKKFQAHSGAMGKKPIPSPLPPGDPDYVLGIQPIVNVSETDIDRTKEQNEYAEQCTEACTDT